MKKAYIQPEFDLLKLSSSEDILVSPLGGEDNTWVDGTGSEGGNFDHNDDPYV